MKPLRCRVGDLCVVVKAHHPENIGKIVQVIAPYDPKRSMVMGMTEADWIVQAPTPMVWSDPDKVWRRKRGPVPDECLQPIRGVAEDDAPARLELETEGVIND